MSKKNVRTKSKNVIKCICSTCEQVASASEGSQHFYCNGIRPAILKALPDNLKGITNPSKKGTWYNYDKYLEAVERAETDKMLQAMAEAEQEIEAIQGEVAA